MMLLRGRFDTHLELDQKMWAYMDGAGLNTAVMFSHLLANQNTDAPDFMADIVAVFLATSVGGAPDNASTWVDTVRLHPAFEPALEGAQRWLGRTSVMPQDVEVSPSDVDQWHPPRHLRFIDGMGRPQGHYLPEQQIMPNGMAQTPRNPSQLCTRLLLEHTPNPSEQWLRDVMNQGYEASVLLLAVGLSGDANTLAWLLQCAVQPEYTVYGLDAFRRITGFDALLSVQADRQLVSTIAPDALAAATQNASQWLMANEAEFLKTTVYFLGKPISRDHLMQVVKTGYQVDRELAAMRLLHDAQPCLIPVRSNCKVQNLVMAQHT